MRVARDGIYLRGKPCRVRDWQEPLGYWHRKQKQKNDKHDYIHGQASAQKRKPLTEGRQNVEKGRKHDILSSDR